MAGGANHDCFQNARGRGDSVDGSSGNSNGVDSVVYRYNSFPSQRASSSKAHSWLNSMPVAENSFGSNFPTLRFNTLAMSLSFGAPLSWKRRPMANESRVPAAQQRSFFGSTANGAIQVGTQVRQNEYCILCKIQVEGEQRWLRATRLPRKPITKQ